MIISYSEYGKMIQKLTDIIRPHKKKFKFIYGIPKGGLPIALHLSNHLNIHMANDETIQQSSVYWDQILVVDDFTNTGITLSEIYNDWGCEEVNHIITATLIFNPRKDIKNLYKPDFYVLEKSENIYMPWDRPQDLSSRRAKNNILKRK